MVSNWKHVMLIYYDKGAHIFEAGAVEADTQKIQYKTVLLYVTWPNSNNSAAALWVHCTTLNSLTSELSFTYYTLLSCIQFFIPAAENLKITIAAVSNCTKIKNPSPILTPTLTISDMPNPIPCFNPYTNTNK